MAIRKNKQSGVPAKATKAVAAKPKTGEKKKGSHRKRVSDDDEALQQEAFDVAEGAEDEATPEFKEATAEDEAEAEEAEAEARDLDIEKIAGEVEAEGHSPADAADVPDQPDFDLIAPLDDSMSISPSMGFGDDPDAEDMASYAGRSVLGAEERNAGIQ